ncbi:MAG: alpha/beta fold hydrolase [Acidimicrobiia bacterium]
MRYILLIVGTFIVLLTVLWLGQRRLIYFPDRTQPRLNAEGWEEITFETDDGLILSAWFAPPPEDAPIVLVLPGNAGNRRDRISLGSALVEKGRGVLLVDYRGYGGNPGSPNEDGLARDARAAAHWVASAAPNNPVIYFGESLGAAVAVELATDLPPAALVLRSPFTSLGDVASAHYPYIPARWLLRDHYPSMDRMGDIDTPVTVILGTDDSVIPPEQSRRLSEAALNQHQLVVVEGSDHNDPELSYGPQVIAAVLSAF